MKKGVGFTPSPRGIMFPRTLETECVRTRRMVVHSEHCGDAFVSLAREGNYLTYESFECRKMDAGRSRSEKNEHTPGGICTPKLTSYVSSNSHYTCINSYSRECSSALMTGNNILDDLYPDSLALSEDDNLFEECPVGAEEPSPSAVEAQASPIKDPFPAVQIDFASPRDFASPPKTANKHLNNTLTVDNLPRSRGGPPSTFDEADAPSLFDPETASHCPSGAPNEDVDMRSVDGVSVSRPPTAQSTMSGVDVVLPPLKLANIDVSPPLSPARSLPKLGRASSSKALLSPDLHHAASNSNEKSKSWIDRDDTFSKSPKKGRKSPHKPAAELQEMNFEALKKVMGVAISGYKEQINPTANAELRTLRTRAFDSFCNAGTATPIMPPSKVEGFTSRAEENAAKLKRLERKRQQQQMGSSQSTSALSAYFGKTDPPLSRSPSKAGSPPRKGHSAAGASSWAVTTTDSRPPSSPMRTGQLPSLQKQQSAPSSSPTLPIKARPANPPPIFYVAADDEEAAKAAVKIQAVVRGKQGRRRVEALKANMPIAEVDLDMAPAKAPAAAIVDINDDDDDELKVTAAPRKWKFNGSAQSSAKPGAAVGERSSKAGSTGVWKL